MAKKNKRVCKWRRAYFISEKCARCKNRKRCLVNIVKKWTIKAAKVASCLAIVVLCITSLISVLGTNDDEVARNYETEVVGMADASSTMDETEVATKEVQEEPEELPEDTEKSPQVIEGKEVPVQEEPLESENVRMVLTEGEKIAMGKVVWKESRGEPYEGKVAVAAVILNRFDTKDPDFGADTGEILRIISYPGAFASIKNFSDEEFKGTQEFDECMRAVEDAISGNDPTKVHFKDGALFFYSTIVDLDPDEMARREEIDVYPIGNHNFHIELK